jgi:tRNA (guanine37-N1)-methyltransferase
MISPLASGRLPLRFDLLTLFPEMFDGFLSTSIPKRAAAKGAVSYHLHNIRDVATDPHKSVDDKPFGGGPGMVMMAPILVEAVERAESQDPRPATRIVLSPQGRVLDQSLVRELATKERLLLVSGRYEGFDERMFDVLRPMEISIGDYVLSGGELAAMVLVDAVVRLLPGVLGAETGADDESFADGLLEYDQYTKPREYRGLTVPEILTSGDHKKVAEWRHQQRIVRTKARRPDLYERFLDAQTPTRSEESK